MKTINATTFGPDICTRVEITASGVSDLIEQARQYDWGLDVRLSDEEECEALRAELELLADDTDSGGDVYLAAWWSFSGDDWKITVHLDGE